MGSGHVMRQITLAVALKSIGFNPVLFCHSIPIALVERAEGFGISVQNRVSPQDSQYLSQEIIAIDCDIAIFDGYEFPSSVVNEVFHHGIFVVLIDDNGDMAEFPCHIILNQNLHADEGMYAGNTSRPVLLLGPVWALIRPEIASLARTVTPRMKTGVLLSVGGTDPRGITPLLRMHLKGVTNERVIATTGVLEGTTLSPSEMADAMARSKAGVIACGTTTWEALCLQLPFVGLVIANNQMEVGRSLVKHGIAPVVDCREVLNIHAITKALQQLLTDISDNEIFSEPLVDGSGALRSAEKITSLAS
jgi:spore coat polysaccharide biosynthesis predicted glycosyltransferase SpsG